MPSRGPPEGPALLRTQKPIWGGGGGPSPACASSLERGIALDLERTAASHHVITATRCQPSTMAAAAARCAELAASATIAVQPLHCCRPSSAAELEPTEGRATNGGSCKLSPAYAALPRSARRVFAAIERAIGGGSSAR
jgi:hypothetical protein